MKFGPVPLVDAVGGIVAHAVQTPDLVLRKGDVVRGDVIATLRRAGIAELVVARLEAGDVGENDAARTVAEAAAGRGVTVERAFTGRANLFARSAGVLLVAVSAIDRINAVDEAITAATLPPYRAVVAGEMVATIKIIPFAVSGVLVARALGELHGPVVDVAPFRPMRVGVVSTLLPALKASVIAKTLVNLGDRLRAAGSDIAVEHRVPHATDALAGAIAALAGACDLLVVFGASAITDRRDVVPAAIEAAGGQVEHLGMPVDPGNLLLLGRVGTTVVIGAPGCARSPKENGFDWVLQRLLAGLPVTRDTIRSLGAGGLLMEIVSRPQPRAGTVPDAFGRDDPA